MTPPLPARPAADVGLDAATQAFQHVGAVSPADARPLADIPGAEAAVVVTLAARGVVREGAPGRYYLYAGGPHERRRGQLRAVLIAVGSVGLLTGLPLLALYLTR